MTEKADDLARLLELAEAAILNLDIDDCHDFHAAANPETVKRLVERLRNAEDKENQALDLLRDCAFSKKLETAEKENSDLRERVREAERQAVLIQPNGSFSERVFKEVLVLNESGCGHFKFQANGGSCILCQQLEAKDAALARLRQAAQPVLNRLQKNGPLVCSCLLEPIIGGEVPCVTCQARKEAAALKAELEAK